MRVEGKKEIIEEIDSLPLNAGYKCKNCREDLVKLRTGLGKAMIHEVTGKCYQSLYWICICVNQMCKMEYKEVRVLERVTEIIDYPLIGKYRDRTNIGGR